MHVSAVEIKNFRSFRHLKLTDLQPAVVVFGENNAGKSNLLHALRLVLDQGLSDRRRWLDHDDFWRGCATPLAGDEISVRLELRGFDGNREQKAALCDCLTGESGSGPLVAAVTYSFRPKAQFEDEEIDYEWLLFGRDDDTNPLSSMTRRALALTVLPALRDALGDLQDPRRSPLNELLKLAAVPEPALQKIASSVEDANKQLVGEPAVGQLIDSVKKRIAAMVGPAHGTEVSLGTGPTAIAEVLRSVRLLVDDGRPLHRAGLGATNVIYMALLLQRTVLRQGTPVAGEILGVEEPEAHLHAHVQRVLFKYLLADSSVWVTTHSAQIASVTSLHSLVLLRRFQPANQPVETEGRRAVSAPMSDEQIADLERYLDVNRADILFSRGVVLVEGIAEKYLAPAAAEGSGLSLDHDGITVCSVEGTDFKPYSLLLATLGIPFVILTDGDVIVKDDELTYPGIRRGLKLLGGDRQKEGLTLLRNEQIDDVLDLLASGGIFVNGSTLEPEYALSAPEALVAAYDDLVASRPRRTALTKSMKAAVASAGKGTSEADKALINRINGVSKGRFAQRVVAHIGPDDHPAYVVDALQHLRTQIGAE